MAAEFIGAQISLISKSSIRYSGVLHSIDPAKATVSLEKVRSHGTEGRKNGVGEIAPNDNVYEFIVFRASDVADLQIDAPAPAQTETAPPLDDPAIMTSTSRPPPQRQQQPQQQQPWQQKPPPYGYQMHPPPPMMHQQTGQYGNMPFPAQQMPPPPPIQHQQQMPFPQSQPSPVPPPAPQRQPQQEEQQQQQQQQQPSKPKEKPVEQATKSTPKEVVATQQEKKQTSGEGPKEQQQQQRRPLQAGKIEIPAAEFDFEQANRKFDKLSLGAPDSNSAKGGEAEEGEIIVIPPAAPLSSSDATNDSSFYDKKSSFFDSISSDLMSRAAGKQERFDRTAERSKNLDTFGEAGSNQYRRGGGRGGPRGGRGRGGAGAGGRGRGGPGRGGRGAPRNNNAQAV